EMEPGPGVGHKPFELQVKDPNGVVVARGVVQSRQVVHLTLPLRPEQLDRFELYVENGGLPTPFDPRILNFRVFQCRWMEEKKELVPPPGAEPPAAASVPNEPSQEPSEPLQPEVPPEPESSAKAFETTLVNPIEVSPASLNFETEPGAFNF